MDIPNPNLICALPIGIFLFVLVLVSVGIVCVIGGMLPPDGK